MGKAKYSPGEKAGADKLTVKLIRDVNDAGLDKKLKARAWGRASRMLKTQGQK